jgi:thiol-disulfide isomerase/thioredoxin
MITTLQKALIAGAGVVARGLGIYFGIARTAAREQSIASLYATTLPDLEQRPQAFSQWKDKTLLINFWATWCEPCRQEIPALTRIQTRYSAKNLQIVGIALDEPERALAFAKSYGINYPVFIGGLGMMDLMHAQGNNIGALPFTIVISPGGAATQTHLGGMSEAEMDALIAQVEAEAKQ